LRMLQSYKTEDLTESGYQGSKVSAGLWRNKKAEDWRSCQTWPGSRCCRPELRAVLLMQPLPLSPGNAICQAWDIYIGVGRILLPSGRVPVPEPPWLSVHFTPTRTLVPGSPASWSGCAFLIHSSPVLGHTQPFGYLPLSQNRGHSFLFGDGGGWHWA
jgi:hypothetical protein